MKYFLGLAERARKKVIRRWSMLALLVLGVGIAQLLLGRFAEVESVIVWWLIVHLLPVSMLIYGGLMNRHYEAPFFPIRDLQAAGGLVILYLLLCLFTLLYIPIAVQVNHQSLTGYMGGSYWWLSGVHVFLFLAVGRLIIRKEMSPAQTRRMLSAHIKSARKQALKQQQVRKAQLLEAIENGKIEDAINNLTLALKDKPEETNHLVVVSATYRNFQKEYNKEVMSELTVQKMQNSIIYSLIDLVETIDHQTNKSK